MKRKYLEAREAKDKEKQPNKVKDFSTDEQSINSTSHGKEESSSKDDSKENVKDKGDVPVVVRGALTNWPSLRWGEQGWLKVLGDQEIEVAFHLEPDQNTTYWRISEFCRLGLVRLIQDTGTLPGRGAPRFKSFMMIGILPSCLDMWIVEQMRLCLLI